MTIDSDNIVDFSPNLRLVGTAHVSSKSVEMVRKEISEYEPDIVAVELCKSRLSSLKEPESGKVIQNAEKAMPREGFRTAFPPAKTTR